MGDQSTSAGSSTVEVVAALKRPIQQWTRGWMGTSATNERGARLGLRSGQQFWLVGRAGVLGDCNAEAAIAALAYPAPALVRRAWADLPAGCTPSAVAAAYTECIVGWGAAELPRFGTDTLTRLDLLARRVIDAAPASLGAVFAGWRAVAPPDDGGGRVALTMHVLRELRGAGSIVAMGAVGLTPLQAVLASPAPPPRTGPVWAEHLGWDGPFEDPTPHLARRERAEALNNELLVPWFDVLDATELAELARLVVEVRNAIDM